MFKYAISLLYNYAFALVAEKENVIPVPANAAKREENNKREINRDGEKEERSKKLRKEDSKENIPVSGEKKLVSNL